MPFLPAARVFLVVSLLLTFFLSGRAALATPPLGSLSDGTFDIGSVVDAGGDDVAVDAVVMPDDSLMLLSGRRTDQGVWLIQLTKLLRNGSVDGSFGSGGTVELGPFAGSGQEPAAMALRPDGSILITGTTYYPGSSDTDFFVLELDRDGVPIGAFPYVAIPFDVVPAGVDRASDILVDPAGRVVVVGTAETGINSRAFAVARRLPGAFPDLSFSGDGRAHYELPGAAVEAVAAVAHRPDGALLIAGTVYGGVAAIAGGPQGVTEGSDRDFAVLAVYGSGEPIDSFGGAGNGWARPGFSVGGVGLREEAGDLALRPDGTAVVVGTITRIVGDDDFGVLVLDRAGRPDPTFGQQGRAWIAFDQGGGLDDGAVAVAAQCDGKVVVSGFVEYRADFPFNELGLVRLLQNGAPDPTFGTAGASVVAFANGVDARAGLLWGGRAVVVGGTVRNGPAGIAPPRDSIVARLHAALVSCNGFEGFDPSRMVVFSPGQQGS